MSQRDARNSNHIGRQSSNHSGQQKACSKALCLFDPRPLSKGDVEGLKLLGFTVFIKAWQSSWLPVQNHFMCHLECLQASLHLLCQGSNNHPCLSTLLLAGHHCGQPELAAHRAGINSCGKHGLLIASRLVHACQSTCTHNSVSSRDL